MKNILVIFILLLLFITVPFMAYAKMQNKAYITNTEHIDAKGYYDRGINKLGQDNLGAIHDFDRAIALQSDYASAYYSRGVCKYLLHDYAGASQDFTKAAE